MFHYDKTTLIIVIVIIIIIIIISGILLTYKYKNNNSTDIKQNLRKLFTEHAVYTKFVITDIIENLGNTTADVNRLIKNQQDIGIFVSPIVGNDNGKKLADLLTTHINLAADCIKSLKMGKGMYSDNNVKKLFANSKQVSAFLSNLNPIKISLDIITKEFAMHNQQVLDIGKAQYNKKYEDVVILYDNYYEHMLMMSDLIYTGLN